MLALDASTVMTNLIAPPAARKSLLWSVGLLSSVKARASVLLKKAVATTAIKSAAGCKKILAWPWFRPASG